MTGTTDVTIDAAKDTVKKLADKDANTTNSDTSDIGEAFRPVVPPWVVTAAYGVSWLYLAGYAYAIIDDDWNLIELRSDVGYESYKAHRRGPSPIEAANFSEPTRIGIAAVQRATFQSIASMALPALTIHTAVAQAKKAFKNVKNIRLRTWGPTATGLAIVPILPYLYDHPVERATERAFDWMREKIIESNGRSQLQEIPKSKTEL
ncbi:hypothetical protein C0989_001849 [Termitomyces sp. Mn162]|nr:hypothetical protein C0989_001849 [Termitomyces sp. Mn162]